MCAICSTMRLEISRKLPISQKTASMDMYEINESAVLILALRNFAP